MSNEARRLIERLGLEPHPEGGHFREIYRHRHEREEVRGHLTSIYYLLEAGQVSHWHRIDAIELWNYHAGAPLELTVVAEADQPVRYRLGVDFEADERPQADGAAQGLAERPFAWRLVLGQLYRRPGISLCRLRAGSPRLVTHRVTLRPP
jgi:predicted cupin superfamily sugar epimerase